MHILHCFFQLCFGSNYDIPLKIQGGVKAPSRPARTMLRPSLTKDTLHCSPGINFFTHVGQIIDPHLI